MSVTLELSKLSGWLNADARCRVKRRACDAGRGGGREVRGRAAAAAQAACTGRARPDSRLGVQDAGGAHVEHVAHARDAGGVEAQRLVEGSRALPSRNEGIRCGARCGPREARGRTSRRCRGTRACDVRHKAGCREDSTGDWGQGVGSAYHKHLAHVCDAGGVPA
eukprot:scaffold44213_cov50-Phaeocystis_antarctica.AAC.4